MLGSISPSTESYIWLVPLNNKAEREDKTSIPVPERTVSSVCAAMVDVAFETTVANDIVRNTNRDGLHMSSTMTVLPPS